MVKKIDYSLYEVKLPDGSSASVTSLTRKDLIAELCSKIDQIENLRISIDNMMIKNKELESFYKPFV